MEQLHNNLTEKSESYKNWHDGPHHKWVHWVVFIVIALVVGGLLSKQIKNLLNLPSNNEGIPVRVDKDTNVLRSKVTLSLEPRAKIVKVGETFGADITLDTAGGPIDGVDVYALHYDPTILEVVDDVPGQKGVQIQPGTILPTNTANIVDAKTGTIKLGQVVAGGTVYTGNGVLATIHFKAIGKGKAFLKFDFAPGSTVDTNAAHQGKDELSAVVDAIYTVTE